MSPIQRHEKHDVLQTGYDYYIFYKVHEQKTFKIFHNLTCMSKSLIYLMECVLSILPYVEKSKTPFYFRLKNHRSDLFDRNAISACRHYAQDKHRFNKHAQFALTKSIRNANKPKESLKEFNKTGKTFEL